MSSDAFWPSPPVAALIGWLIPGGGHWMVGQRVRGIVVGFTVVLLFLSGMLIGGVRAIEVPLFDEQGRYMAQGSLLRETAGKIWSVPQILTGPLAVVGGYFSVQAAQPQGATAQPLGALSHSRINEIASLYMGVAGVLNLLAMVDAAHRAGRSAADEVKRPRESDGERRPAE